MLAIAGIGLAGDGIISVLVPIVQTEECVLEVCQHHSQGKSFLLSEAWHFSY